MLTKMVTWLHHVTGAINSEVMEQDDPCILHLLRTSFLDSPSKETLNLQHPEVENPSMGQSQSILEILKDKVCAHLLLSPEWTYTFACSFSERASL